MKRKDRPPLLKYYLTIVGMAISLLMVTACIMLILRSPKDLKGAFKGKPSLKFVLCLVGATGGIVGIKISDIFHKRLRDQVEYDKSGISRRYGDYSKLSKAERDKIEEANMLASEVLLKTSELQSMTHKGSKDAQTELEQLIGLKAIKDAVNRMAAQMEYDKSQKTKKEPDETCYHMCFLGPPGTGKTTVARIMTGLLYKYKIIKKNECVETNGTLFRGSNPNESAQKTLKILHHAAGGVLFIDEAYSLTGDESSIATLIKEMEDQRDGVVLIFAGYDNEMEALIRSNPGFKSRIQKYFRFTPYTLENLQEIFTRMADDKGLSVTEMALDRFSELIAPMMSQKDFGNGRAVRNILQSSLEKHKENCIAEESAHRTESKVDKDKEAKRRKVLVYEDICAYKSI